jgi:hypothetical protein
MGSWFLLLSLSQAADLATTWWGFRAGVPETNPMVAVLLRGGEFFAYAGVKAALVLAMVLLVHANRSRVTIRGVQAVAVAFTLVAILNAVGILTT